MAYKISGDTFENSNVRLTTDANDNLIIENPKKGETLEVDGNAVLSALAEKDGGGTATLENYAEVHADLSTHATQIDQDYTIPAGRGAVIAERISGTGSISGEGSLTVAPGYGVENPLSEDIKGNGRDITGLGNLGVEKSHTTLEPVANIRQYGAVGDGVTDDLSAFADAIAAVDANGGGVVYVPGGTYLVSSTIDVTTTNTVHLRGDGEISTITTDTPELLPLIQLDSPSGTVSSLELDGGGVASYGLRVRTGFSASNLHVHNFEDNSNNISVGIELLEGAGGSRQVTQNEIWDIRAPNGGIARGIRTGGTGNEGRIIISQNYIGEITDWRDADSISIAHGTTYVIISHNILRNSHNRFIKAQADPGTHVAIDGNVMFTDTAQDVSPGIGVQCENVVVSNNLMYFQAGRSNGKFVGIGSSEGDVTIVNNDCHVVTADTNFDGFNIPEGIENVTIRGNRVSGISRDGVRIGAGTAHEVSNNRFIDARIGVALMATDTGTHSMYMLTNNLMPNLSSHAFQVQSTGKILVDGNVGTTPGSIVNSLDGSTVEEGTNVF